MWPGWPTIHECSPGGRAFRYKLARECRAFTATHDDPSCPFGTMHSSGNDSRRRARIIGGRIEHFCPRNTKATPSGTGRALVTVDDLGNGNRNPWNTLIVAHKGDPVDPVDGP